MAPELANVSNGDHVGAKLPLYLQIELVDIGRAEVQPHVVRKRKVRAIQCLRSGYRNSARGAAQRRRLSEGRLASWQRTGDFPGISLNLEGQRRLAWRSVDTGGVHPVKWRVLKGSV